MTQMHNLDSHSTFFVAAGYKATPDLAELLKMERPPQVLKVYEREVNFMFPSDIEEDN